MPSSKLLKERIESIQDTMKITNAMYLISSSKLRKARKNYQNVSPYFNRMRDTISRVVPHLPEEPVHPFFHERNIANPKRAYIVLTADKGMAGAYNQNIIKFLKENADENDRFYVIGQTGYRALYHKDPRLVEDFHYGATEPTLQRARDITMDAIDDFKTGKMAYSSPYCHRHEKRQTFPPCRSIESNNLDSSEQDGQPAYPYTLYSYRNKHNAHRICDIF